MRILMLGNSFTFANNMPDTLANLIDAEVVQHTRGGARLAEQLNPDTKMGGMTQVALENEKWDYVILQEMSNGPITSRESFLNNTVLLCERIRSNGAVPVLYATWAYQKGGKQLASFGPHCGGRAGRRPRHFQLLHRDGGPPRGDEGKSLSTYLLFVPAE